MGVRPPIPRCEACGARVAQPHGPKLTMAGPSRPGIVETLEDLRRVGGSAWDGMDPAEVLDKG